MSGRDWALNAGQDGMFWNLPFQTTATWITSGPLITALRQGNGFVLLPGNFAAPIAIGTASDPLIEIVDASGALPNFQLHIPVGTIQEMPITGTDNGLGVIDRTKPYAIYQLNTVTMNTNGVQASGTVITCHNGIAIDDACGPIMMDAVTGQPGTGNMFGVIQDWELSAANADPNYVIQHMLQYSMDPAEMNSNAPIWPLLVIDTSFPNTGTLNQGYTVGIPASVPMPSGLTRGGQLLWKTLQQFGGIFYNVSGNGTMTLACSYTTQANQALANDIASSFSAILPHLCILSNQTDINSMKGMVGGVRSDAFPAPPLMDLSPTGGVEVAPSTMGAFYPSGYNVTPTAPTPPLQIPGAPVSLTAGTVTSSSVVLSWSAPTSGGAVATYLIDDRVGNTGAFVQMFTTAGTSFTVTGLQPATTYNFEVFGQNTSGTGPASNIVSVTTAAVVPAAPTGLTVGTVTASSVALSWTAPAGTVTGYLVDMQTGGTGAFSQIAAPTGTSYTATGLQPGTAYAFKVLAKNSAGTGAASNTATATTKPEISMSTAVPCNTFLGSIGVNTFMSQGVPYTKYTALLEYTGIRNIRENISAESSILSLAAAYPPLKANVGIPGTATPAILTSAVASAANLASAGCLLSFEGANEPNNFTISWNGTTGGGTGDWTPVAEMQEAWYAAVQANTATAGYPVFTITEPGAEQTNVGLQFLTIPTGAGATMPDGTVYATHANCHNYVISSAGYADNIAWDNADPVWTAGPWDALVAEFHLTWLNHFNGYTLAQLPSLPRVTTETGWDDVADPAGPGGARWTQGVVLTNQYLAQFTQGWAYTFVYNFVDGEGGSGNYGFYDSSLNPKLSAMFLHNMTTILADTSNFTAGSLGYSIPSEPATVHDLLLQKANGTYELVVWGESASQTVSTVTVNLGQLWDVVNIYDITVGTTPTQTLTGVSSVSLSISDHAMIIEMPVNTVTPASVQAQVSALETMVSNLNSLLTTISTNVGQL